MTVIFGLFIFLVCLVFAFLYYFITSSSSLTDFQGLYKQRGFISINSMTQIVWGLIPKPVSVSDFVLYP